MGNSAFPSSPNQADARVIRLRSAHLSLDAPFAAMSFPMPNKMLIDATHPEETRVVVVRGNRVEEFDFESAQRKQLRGNIYLAKVTRVEPSLQAAFIEYGGNRHGFLAFSEIHPDYYQIPVADRQALIEADERAHREAEEESEQRSSRRRSRHRNSRRRSSGERVQSEVIEITEDGQPAAVAAPAHDDAGALDGAAAPDDTTPAVADAESAPSVVEGEIAGGAAQALQDGRIDDGSIDEGDAPRDAGAAAADADDPPQAVAPAPAAIVPVEEAIATAEFVTATDWSATETVEADAAADITPDATSDAAAETAIDDAGGETDAETSETSLDDQPDAASDEHRAAADDDEDDDNGDDDDTDEEVESVGGDDALEEVPERAFRPRRQYKIQEVIKRRQVMLVQVVKEERGNKGAALTTYLSLAGRYAVLMPNTARGGGISRKITSAQDRSRLKEVVQDLDVPEGMGIILRTAGASRTKPEIKRDFEYLIRMWETVRDLTLRSQAPTLVYEEGSLIKRSLRDLYNKEIDEILVAGEAGYHEARDFMKMLMPSSVRAVKLYQDGQPLFSRMGVESQLDAMFSPIVQLKSGGYIVINQTEALVSIDVNSGRSTREHHIEDTALKTNLEAAEEVARQLRLRDLAGLIVIDFIDMDEKRNNRAVERKLSDCLRQDRARIQVGRISHFGLLEMSRQRIRASVLESSTEPCPHCGGTGHVRSVASVALQLLRNLEETLMKGATHNMVVRTRTDVALYVLNHKRGHLRDLETGFQVTLSVVADPTINGSPAFAIERGEQVHTLEAAKALLASQQAAVAQIAADDGDEDYPFDVEAEVETEETEGLTGDAAAEDGEADDGRRRRRRRRRRSRAGEAREPDAERGDEDAVSADAASDDGAPEAERSEDRPSAEDEDATQAQDDDSGERRPRRRGRRGGRRRRGNGAQDGLAGSIADDLAPVSAPEAADAVADFDGTDSGIVDAVIVDPVADTHAPAEAEAAPREDAASDGAEVASAEPAHHGATETPAGGQDDVRPDEGSSPEPVAGKPSRRRSTVREKVSLATDAPSLPASEQDAPSLVAAPEAAVPDASATVEPVADAEPSQAQPRRGWWSRRFGGS